MSIDVTGSAAVGRGIRLTDYLAGFDPSTTPDDADRVRTDTVTQVLANLIGDISTTHVLPEANADSPPFIVDWTVPRAWLKHRTFIAATAATGTATDYTNANYVGAFGSPPNPLSHGFTDSTNLFYFNTRLHIWYRRASAQGVSGFFWQNVSFNSVFSTTNAWLGARDNVADAAQHVRNYSASTTYLYFDVSANRVRQLTSYTAPTSQSEVWAYEPQTGLDKYITELRIRNGDELYAQLSDGSETDGILLSAIHSGITQVGTIPDEDVGRLIYLTHNREVGVANDLTITSFRDSFGRVGWSSGQIVDAFGSLATGDDPGPIVAIFGSGAASFSDEGDFVSGSYEIENVVLTNRHLADQIDRVEINGTLYEIDEEVSSLFGQPVLELDNPPTLTTGTFTFNLRLEGGEFYYSDGATRTEQAGLWEWVTADDEYVYRDLSQIGTGGTGGSGESILVGTVTVPTDIANGAWLGIEVSSENLAMISDYSILEFEFLDESGDNNRGYEISMPGREYLALDVLDAIPVTNVAGTSYRSFKANRQFETDTRQFGHSSIYIARTATHVYVAHSHWGISTASLQFRGRTFNMRIVNPPGVVAGDSDGQGASGVVNFGIYFEWTLFQHAATQPAASTIPRWSDTGWIDGLGDWYQYDVDPSSVGQDTSLTNWIGRRSATRNADGTYQYHTGYVHAEFDAQYAETDSTDDSDWHDTRTDDDEWLRFRLPGGNWAVVPLINQGQLRWRRFAEDILAYNSAANTGKFVNISAIDISQFAMIRADVQPFQGFGDNINNRNVRHSAYLPRPDGGWVLNHNHNEYGFIYIANEGLRWSHRNPITGGISSVMTLGNNSGIWTNGDQRLGFTMELRNQEQLHTGTICDQLYLDSFPRAWDRAFLNLYGLEIGD